MKDTKIYDFEAGIDRSGTNAIKWTKMDFLYPGAPNDAVPFWVADSDLPVADPIVKALQDRASHPAFGYTWHMTDEYLNCVTNWYRDRFDWEVKTEEIVFAPGIVNAISISIREFTKEGDGVMIQTPVYHPFYDMIKKNNRKLIKNELKLLNGKYEIDFNDFEEKAKDSNTKMFVLCSPHNPVGRVWNKEELHKMAKICSENEVLLFSDEIHFDLIRNGIKHYPISKAAAEYANNMIVATAPSKTFNIPGLQMSNNVISDKRIRTRFLEAFSASGQFGANVFAGVATLAAYKSGHNWLDQLKDFLDSNVMFLDEYIKENLPKAKLIYPEATYLAWIDFREYGLEHKELVRKFVHEAKVVLSDGKTFGDEGSGFMRFNFACNKALIKEGLDRIKNVLH